MPSKDRRTKAELLAELAGRNERIEHLVRNIEKEEVQHRQALAEKEKEITRLIWEKNKEIAEKGRLHQEAMDKLEREIFLLKLGDKERRKLLKLQALGGIRVASFLEGKVEGVLASLKMVLSNTKTSDDDFPPELGKILEEMARDLADVDDDFDEEDELGID